MKKLFLADKLKLAVMKFLMRGSTRIAIEVDDLVDEWHMADTNLGLHEYVGCRVLDIGCSFERGKGYLAFTENHKRHMENDHSGCTPEYHGRGPGMYQDDDS